MQHTKDLLNDGSKVRRGLKNIDKFTKGTFSNVLQEQIPDFNNFNSLNSSSESLIMQPDALRVEKNIFKEWKYEKND